MISIIIPSYNEQDHIGALLHSIMDNIENDIEVIVVDGGSSDRTIEVVNEFPKVRLINSEKGRATQLNNGAKESKGDILFFVHADSILPDQWREHILKLFDKQQYIAGTFYLKFDKDGFWYRLYSRFSKIKHALFTFGDQGLFVKKADFDKVGGYPLLPIMEDYQILIHLQRLGKIAKLNSPMTTSSRKFSKNGVVFQETKNVIIVLLYLVGVKPERLAKWYR